LAAALIGTLSPLAACSGSGGGSGDGGEGVAAVQPSRVDAASLRAAASDPRLVRFYEARQWQPAWTEATAKALVDSLGGANRHGLDRNLYLADVERAESPAAREAALSLAALNYGEALARGRVDPRRIEQVYSVPRPETDVAAGLNRALQGNDVPGWLAGLAPQDEEYRMLSEAFLRAAQARTAGLSPLTAGPAIRPGSSDARVSALAQLLAAAGYYTPPQQQQQQGQQKQGGQSRPARPRYGPELVAAVRSLQEDYGLTASGLVGEATVAAVNDAALDRARTLAINLERRRWLKRDPEQTRIDVNIAAAQLAYWRDGAVANQRRVVVGEPDHQTPELGSPLFRLVANPTWTVPRSIQEEEIEPEGPAYMARHNMEWRDGWIVQKSGPTNSLGLVKFDMRNDESIYLHDTPAKALFGEDMRQFSHGCVRVQDALGFAALIAADQGISEEWNRARATGEETFVQLPRAIPVRLLYQTAFLDGGRIRYRLDAYGWDNEVARQLGLRTRPRQEYVHRRHDVGP
jgi:murein L,D-transpeptidase YcbB/YkuD